jgi:hypothetical protein
MRLFLPFVLHTVWCLPKPYAHTNNCKKTISWEKTGIKNPENKNTTAQIRD